MGILITPKHSSSVYEFKSSLKVCFDHQYENEGWLTMGNATTRDPGFTFYLFEEYLDQRYHLQPKSDNSDYTKDAQLPEYFGFIEKSDRGVKITSSGVALHNAFLADDKPKIWELFLVAIENKQFGRNNCGCERSDSDCEAPGIFLISSLLLNGLRRKEFAYILEMMNEYNKDLSNIIAEILFKRDASTTIDSIYSSDIKFIPLLIDLGFFIEESQLVKVSHEVIERFGDRITKVKIINTEPFSGECPIIDDLVDSNEDLPKQIIYYGAPGTGKSYVVKDKTKDESVIRTTFHPDSDYSTFVGAYKPTTRVVRSRDMAGHVIMEHGKEVTEDRIVYEFVDQAFLQAYIKAWKYMSDTEDGKEPKKQYLVIEEINRGNCAQIFGDLFQLLDRNYEGFSDYFIEADSDIQKRLKKAFEGFNLDSKKEDINSMYYKGRDVVQEVLDGTILLLPNNLYIWATMNTSDQSLFPIDSAFKRRWDWKYIPISKGRDNYGNPLDWIIACGNKSYSWWSFLEKINALIGSTTKSEDKKLGYFFCNVQDGEISAEKFVGKVVFYLWNDVFNDFEFADKAFDDPEDTKNPKITFDKFFNTNGEKGIKPVAEDKVELFLKNLGVSIISSNDMDENTGDEEGNEKNERDKSRYSVNGEGVFNKGDTAYKVLEKYINSYPDKTPEEIVAAWKNLNLSDVRHIVETKEEFDQRTQGSSDSNPRAKKCPCGEGKEVYLTTQWGIGNFPYFVEAVNSADWGITISKIQ